MTNYLEEELIPLFPILNVQFSGRMKLRKKKIVTRKCISAVRGTHLGLVFKPEL